MSEVRPYTDAEIVTLYREARKKGREIQILAELNDTDTATIKRILKSYGVLEEPKRKRANEQREKDKMRSD